MTAWPSAELASYDGPAWAAPEHVERWVTRPKPGRGDAAWGVICRMMANGRIDAEQFQRAVQIKNITDPLRR